MLGVSNFISNILWCKKGEATNRNTRKERLKALRVPEKLEEILDRNISGELRLKVQFALDAFKD